MNKPLDIDGSRGEGGGQVLRTALAIALCDRQPVHVYNIRSKRPKPGLRRQHLVAVEAAAAVGNAEVTGAYLGSTRIHFSPNVVTGGSWRFDIGTAGSTTLVLQTLLPSLLSAQFPSAITIIGGTHNPLAPSFEFFQLAFLPLLARMGGKATASLERHGFFPGGGGRINISVEPTSGLRPLSLEERASPSLITACIKIANLPTHIAWRERDELALKLNIPDDRITVEEVDADGPGNAVMVRVTSNSLTEVFTEYGRRGLPAEEVARRAARQARDYVASGVPVGPHLADQLLLPMALAGSGSFVTMPPSRHTRTQAALVQEMLNVTIALDRINARRWRVEVSQR